MKKIAFTLVTIFIFTSITSAQVKWTVDKKNTEVGFNVKHMLVASVKGKFEDYEINFTQNGNDFTNADIEVIVKTQSVNTKIKARDRHLRSGDFFLVEEYPEMKFETKSVTKSSETTYKVRGAFSLRGITKDIELDVELLETKQEGNQQRARFQILGEINRQDFGLNYNLALESGGLVVAKEVVIDIKLEVTRDN